MDIRQQREAVIVLKVGSVTVAHPGLARLDTPTVMEGARTKKFGQFFLKTAWKQRKLDPHFGADTT